MAKVIKRLEAHYKTQNVAFGKVYRWCPEGAVIECSCGKRTTFTASKVPTCSQCEVDHLNIVAEALDAQGENKVQHPWRSLRPYYTPTRGS